MLRHLSSRALKSSQQKPSGRARIKTEKKFGLEEEHFIYCRTCGSVITTPESIIAVDNHHVHSFSNPAGIVYEIGCFSSAEGCGIHGDPTAEHTWFEGFSWSFSICLSCLSHLGWFYQNETESFFGLILDRLTDHPVKL